MKRQVWQFSMLLVFFSVIFSCGCKKQPPEEPELPKLKVNGLSIYEGDTDNNSTVLIELDKAATSPITVNYRFVDESALFGEDFTATATSVTINSGETTVNIPFTIIGDTLREPDESFRIAIDKADGATLVNTSVSITLKNDDDFIVVPKDGYSTPTSYAGYKMAWQDEFSGSSLSNDWTLETGDNGWGNNEWQYYTSGQNVIVSNGQLVIEAREESFQGASYTSTRMITRNNQSFQYGRVDIRAVLPEGQGIWPALWMLGDDFQTNGWPACGEIDIMEIVGHEPSTVHGTIHWDNNGHAQFGDSYTLSNGKKFSDEYHVFSIIWDDTSIKWFVNDIQYNEVNITAAHMSEFHAPFFFIFNIAVGGNWPGYPDATTVFPQQMIVDYIRVFEKV